MWATIIGFVLGITSVFVFMKVLNLVDWSWYLTLSPALLFIAFSIGYAIWEDVLHNG